MTFILAVLGGILGAALGWITVAFAAIVISGNLGVSDFEGARAMGAIFGIGPIGGLVGLIVGMWLVLRARGVRGFTATFLRMPLVIDGIAALTAGGFWIAWEMRPGLNSNGAPPRLLFEIRLPAGTKLPASRETIGINLSTEKNTMPGTLFAGEERMDGDRPVIRGSVEMHFRSGWRILELKLPAEPDRLFVLKLATRPGHDKEFRDWEHVTHVADTGDNRPRIAGPQDAFDIRYRVAWPGED
jgi:MFS family permease